MWGVLGALGLAAYATDWLNRKFMGKGAGETLAQGYLASQSLQGKAPVPTKDGVFTTTSPNRAIIPTLAERYPAAEPTVAGVSAFQLLGWAAVIGAVAVTINQIGKVWR